MPVIMYNGANTHTLQSEHGLPDEKGRREKPIKVRFLPGPNEVPDADWERIKKEKACKNLISMGQLQPLVQHKAPSAPAKGKPQRIEADADNDGLSEETEPVEDLDSIDVSKMDAWAAKALVETVIDKARLKVYLKQEKKRLVKRTMVSKAIDKQLEALEMPVSEEGVQSDLQANAVRQV